MLKQTREKTMAILFLAFIVMTLTSVSVPVVSAKTQKYIITQAIWIWPDAGFDPLGLHPDEHIYWLEQVYTVDGRHIGIIYDYGTAKSYIVGKTEHFFEEWALKFDDDDGGGWIAGTVKGVWNLATFKARTQGLITDASPDRVSFIGRIMDSQGVTSNPDDSFDPITGEWLRPITGASTCFIGP